MLTGGDYTYHGERSVIYTMTDPYVVHLKYSVSTALQ